MPHDISHESFTYDGNGCDAVANDSIDGSSIAGTFPSSMMNDWRKTE